MHWQMHSRQQISDMFMLFSTFASSIHISNVVYYCLYRPCNFHVTQDNGRNQGSHWPHFSLVASKIIKQKKIDSFEMCFWRRMIRIPWTAMRTNPRTILEQLITKLSAVPAGKRKTSTCWLCSSLMRTSDCLKPKEMEADYVTYLRDAANNFERSPSATKNTTEKNVTETCNLIIGNE